MKTHVNSRQMISGLLEQKTLSSVKRKGAAKLCESPEEALGRYRVLVLPLSPSWREDVTLPAPWHKDGWTRQALLVITARNPRVRSLLSALCALLKQGTNTRLCSIGPSPGITLFSLCGVVIYRLASTLHEAAGRGDGAKTSPFHFTPTEECERAVTCVLSLPGAGNLCNKPALIEWFAQVSTDAHRGQLEKFCFLPLPFPEDTALAQLFTCRSPWVQRFYFFNHKFTLCCGFPLVNFSGPL